MPWKEAIERVIRERGAAMHYAEIAEEIVRKGLREDVGATPSSTVNSIITVDINTNADASRFLRVSRGSYVLRETRPPADALLGAPEADAAESRPGIIRAFGMYWRRNLVSWTKTPKLLGQEQIGASTVDLAEQVGVYLLHDTREVVYVGRAVDRPLGKRLYEHTSDRLNGRWDRFSWFGLSEVTEEGRIRDPSLDGLTLADLVATLEALLIEGLEPRQNRKRGDEFRAIEYLQVEDPSIVKRRKKQLLEDFASFVDEKG